MLIYTSGMGRMELERYDAEGVPVLELRGDLDIAGLSDVEAAFAAVEAGEPILVAIDLRRVAFIDSSGLRVLLSADARARQSGRRVVLVRGAPIVHRVFEIALLDRRLAFVDDLDELPAVAQAG